MTKKREGLFIEIAGKDKDKVNILAEALAKSVRVPGHTKPLAYNNVVVLESPRWQNAVTILDFYAFYNNHVLPHLSDDTLVIIKDYVAELVCTEHLNKTNSLVLANASFGKPDICIVTEEKMYREHRLVTLIGQMVDKIVVENPLQDEYQIPETSINIINRSKPKTGLSKLLKMFFNLFRR